LIGERFRDESGMADCAPMCQAGSILQEESMTLAGARPHWLNRERVTGYPRLFVCIFAVTVAVWVLMSKHMVDSKGKPLGGDFIAYWIASKFALSGHAAEAYNLASMVKAERAFMPASDKVFDWLYPPSFFLVVLPLGLMPYFVAYFVWIGATLTAYVAVFRRIVTGSVAMWCLAGFSGIWVNGTQGQNGFLTAALAAAGLIALPKRPVLAGVFLGLVTLKPHLALLFPVALLAIGAWRALASSAVTAVAFVGLGTAVLGRATLKAFLADLPDARMFVETGAVPWSKMPTVFSFFRTLGVPVAGAYAAHITVALVAAVAVWYVWRRSMDWQLRAAALMTATCMMSPYMFDYDLAWLAFPIAWLAVIGMRDGWLAGEREVLVLAWLLPMLMAPVTAVVVVQPGPFVLGALLWVVVRRCRSPRVSGVVGAGISPSYTP
jgi:hypothetical protein